MRRPRIFDVLIAELRASSAAVYVSSFSFHVLNSLPEVEKIFAPVGTSDSCLLSKR